MSIFSIADLHFSEARKKPMDVFGGRWACHTEKITGNWRKIVTDTDTVVIPGDISWGMTLEDALPDLLLINSLPGTKIIGKGNHDFWWGTLSKINKLFDENGISTIKLLQNNAFEVENYIVGGTRGWYVEERYQNTVGNVDYQKIVNREVIRLKNSLNRAAELRGDDKSKKILVYFHFPPVFNGFVCREIVDVLKEYEIKNCYFGHIHSCYSVPKTVCFEGISMTMISSDFLNFIPMITVPE